MKRNFMLYRSILFYAALFGCLLTLTAAGSICFNQLVTTKDVWPRWPSPPRGSLFLLVMVSQGLAGYLLWWLTHQFQRSSVRTEALHSIVHEFQTPIAAIRMATDILDSPVGRNRTEKYLRIIREETERLQHDVETMLTLARADHNTLVLEPEPVLVHELLHSVAERHGNYLQLHMTGENPILLADRLHLTNVLHNLLDNAIKYSVGEPTITVRAETSSRGLSISVGDRGIGIPPHLLPQIFQPFFRVHDRNQPSIKGFGLGLSYVQRIIQAHNWTIQVKSESGQGSEFRIHIPAAALLSQQPGYSAHKQAV